MAVNYVNFSGQTSFNGSAFIADNKVFLRSSSVDDDNDFVVAGLKNSDSSAVTETLQSLSNGGKIERVTSNSLKELHLFSNRNSGSEVATEGTVEIRLNNGTAATGSITILSVPSENTTLSLGLTGFQKTFTFKSSVASSNDVGLVSDLNELAANLASAINDSVTGTPQAGGEAVGAAWLNDDGPNPYFVATVSGSTVTLTDRVTASRQLPYVLSVSDESKFAICAVRGGIDGTLIASISQGLKSASTSINEGIELKSEDQTLNTLPGGFTGASQSVATRGKFAVDIRTGTPNGAVNAAIQVSNDNVNFRNVPTTTITNLASDQDQQLVGDDLFAEFARLNITNNQSTSATVANIAIISQS